MSSAPPSFFLISNLVHFKSLPVYPFSPLSKVFSQLHPIDLDVAKAEDAADPRRQGRSRTKVLRTFANKGDAVSHGFPEG